MDITQQFSKQPSLGSSTAPLSPTPGDEEMAGVVGLLCAMQHDLVQVKDGLEDIRAIITARRKDHYTVEEIG